MAIRNWFGGKKAPAEEATELQAEGAPPQAAPAAGEAPPAAAPPAPSGPIDFVAILAASGIQPDARERVVKAKSLLKAMPQDGASATKRQAVEAAFQAFDIPTQKIIDNATAEIEALRAYIRAGEEDKSQKLAAGERRIADLEGQIRDVRAAMAQAVAAQERRQRLTLDEIGTVEPILKFFGREAPPVVAKPSKPADAPEVEAIEVEEASLSDPEGSNAANVAGAVAKAKGAEVAKAPAAKRSA